MSEADELGGVHFSVLNSDGTEVDFGLRKRTPAAPVEPPAPCQAFKVGTQGNRFQCETCGRLWAEHRLPESGEPPASAAVEALRELVALHDSRAAAHDLGGDRYVARTKAAWAAARAVLQAAEGEG